MTVKDRWTQEDLAAGNLAISGLLVSRVAIPKSEFGNFTASGVEEVEGWAPSATPRNPFRLVTPQDTKVLYLARPNGFINLGLHFILDRIFNINTPDTAIDSMGISNDTTTVIATTLLIDPSAGAGSPDFQALAAGVGAAATSRTGNTVTCSSGWEPADFTTVFAITKVGLSTNAADSGDDTVPTVQGVVNIIGGTGGSAPFNEPFTIDLTTVSDFDLTLQQQITAQAT